MNKQSNIRHADVVCAGFGPAAISVAAAIADRREEGDVRAPDTAVFFEKAANSEWHPELLLPGTDINHSAYRDLVTPRNPRSRFSFAMYLKEKGRMYKFGLLGRPASRAEWSDYVTWVAAQLSSYVSYNDPVQEILPVLNDGRLTALDVVTTSGITRTRNLILSTGSMPKVPEQFLDVLGARAFHTSEYLSRVRALPKLPRRWLVVGSGQSASEATMDLLRHGAQIVHSLHRSSGFRLTQLGQFPNLVFSPEQADYFHTLSLDNRARLFTEIKNTNYAGIDPDESQALYSLVYEDAIAGLERLKMHIHSEVVDVEQLGAHYQVLLRDGFTGLETSLEVDGIVLATGYSQPLVPPLLTQLQPWLAWEADGGLHIQRDYKVKMQQGIDINVYVNGLSERAHGIGDGQSFSLMAMRAERILDAIHSQYSESNVPLDVC